MGLDKNADAVPARYCKLHKLPGNIESPAGSALLHATRPCLVYLASSSHALAAVASQYSVAFVSHKLTPCSAPTDAQRKRIE